VEDYGARCLDGSPGGYYLREVPGSQDWVFYLQGGGLCISAFDCRARLNTHYGSSRNWSATFEDDSNVLNEDASANPFAGFNAVYLPYCSGDTFAGSKKGRNWFLGGVYSNGHLIMQAVLDHIHNTTSMAQGVNRVLLAGYSAGGIGVLHNADWLTETITGKFGFSNATVKASPQGGLFFPEGACLFQEFKLLGKHCPRIDVFESGWVAHEEHALVHPGCMQELKSRKKCWSAGILAEYVKTPLFWAQNRYDSNQMPNEMLCKDCTGNASEASDSVKGFMSFFGQQTERTLHRLESEHGHSVFMPNCYEHTKDLCMRAGPLIQGHSYSDSVSDWFFKGHHQAHYDTCGEFPCNPQCSCDGVSPKAVLIV
jgi:hypothetical protein